MTSNTPGPDQHWTVSVPKNIFDEIKTTPEFCSLVTLARAVNAIHFVHAPLIGSESKDDPKSMRDRYNSLLFTCALFAEAIPLVEGMQRYFKNNEDFKKIGSIIHSKEAKELKRDLYKLRKTLVFHFDALETQRQLKTLELQNPIFATARGQKKLDTYLELADVVALRTLFGEKFPQELNRPVLRSISELVLSFLVAAEEFMVSLMKERGWTEVRLF